MVGSLRSGKVVGKVMSASEIDQYLEPLQKKNIEGMNLALNMIFNEHLSMVNNRKIDDSEQFSRIINLRLSGFKVDSNDSPDHIMKSIQDQAAALDLGIEASAFDCCHRIGGKYYKNGILYQDVLLKLCLENQKHSI